MISSFRLGIVLLLSFSSFLQAQNSAQLAKLDSLKSILGSENQILGSYCIRHQGKLWAMGTIGSDTEGPLYRIGSISKTFTSVLVLQAAEKELLSLEDPISKWFPELKNAEQITVRMLLNHRSGIHNFTDDASYAAIMYSEQSREAMLQRIALLDPDFAPDTDFNYSNTNYVLASYILEDIYEKPIAEILAKKIVKKLKLANTYFFEVEKRSESEVDSYFWTGEWTKMGRTHPSIPLGAGAIVSNPMELCQFMEAIHHEKLIEAESLNAMKSEANYGLGLMRFPFYDHLAYGHNGGIDGFQSHASYFPEDELSVAVCLNGAQYPLNDLLIDLLSIYFEREDYQLPEFSKISLEEAQLQVYIGTYKSANFPLDIEVFVKEGELFGQASGQGAFPLTATGENQFEFKAGGIKMLFNPDANYCDFEQRGMKIRFTR